MVWRLTAAGVQELVHPAALRGSGPRRDLLVRVDGVATVAALLAAVPAAHPDDLNALAGLGLIAAVETLPLTRRTDPGRVLAAGAREPATWSAAAGLRAQAAAASQQPAVATEAPHDPGALARTLRQLVAAELGILGFSLALALEKAADGDELRAVAQRALEQIRTRRGEPAAAAARQMLFGL